MRLYHFSDDPRINIFKPRPVRMAVDRPAGFEWLNGPLVRAIDEKHQSMYLFLRKCPRILLWSTERTTAEAREYWWQGSARGKLAYIEQAWLERLVNTTIYRYEMPAEPFENLEDAGMWVAKEAVKPLRLDALNDLIGALEAHDVELRVVESLVPPKGVWQTSLHASGLRLRNAQGWGKPSWTHSKKDRTVAVTEPT